MDETLGRSGKSRLLLYVIPVAIFLALIIALQAGFIVFTQNLPQTRKIPASPADGIVALTGGAKRIRDAMDLLANGRARRLLISGVYPHTNLTELMRSYKGYNTYFKCCVELDYKAQNTIGNALETRRWADKYKLKSLIVVTSAYHMPRSLLELHHVLPRTTLIPYPVLPGRKLSGSWPTNPFTQRVLFFEYLKYILARIRLRLFAPVPGSGS
jgi:uncharacterized SAM-binding protein YcdF (DUF218 family)